MVETLYTDLITAAFDHLDGSEVTDEEMADIIDNAISSSDTESKKTVEYTLQFEEKDGDYVLKEVPDELLDTATAGVYRYLTDVSESFSEDFIGELEPGKFDAVTMYAPFDSDYNRMEL